MDSIIKVENVSKKFRLYYDRPLSLKERVIRGSKGVYKEFYALEDVSFNIKRGSTVGLLGQNGCGKSTLLKIINRTMFPEAGKVTVKGKVASLIELGAGFHPELSGRENIYTNATIFGFTKAEIDERMPEIIRFSELEDFIDNPIRTYSSGMYARLGFSVAIHVDADILLVDEILGVGDMNFQAKCANKIYEMRKKGITIVMVSHDATSIERLCDYAVWLDHGKKMDEGQPRYIINRYMEFMANKQEEQERKDNNIEKSNDIENIKNKDVLPEQNRIEIDDITHMGSHFGTGDVIFTDVQVLDEKGVDKRVFQSGEDVRVIVSYKKQISQDDLTVNIGLEIKSKDGSYIYGTNTSRDGNIGLVLKQEGKIELRLNHLNLVEGIYTIGMAIANQEETINYDYYHELVEIRIYSQIRDIGLYRIQHEFILDEKPVSLK